MSVIRTICDQCKCSAIDSYKFIRMCKENSNHLSKAIESVAESFDNTIEDIHCYKSLFVALNTADFASNQYYDDKQQVHTPCAASKRFRSIISAKVKPKIELDEDPLKINVVHPNLDYLDSGLKREERKKRDWTNYDIPEIPTCDLIVHSNDPSHYQCKACLKRIQDAKKIRWHYFRYHYPRNVKCTKCPRRFISQVMLQQHKDDYHRIYLCRQCGKHCKGKYVLRKHESNHNITITCQECSRVYKSKEAFKKHITDDICKQKFRKTPEQGIYECNYCNKRYCYKPYLAKHIKFEHENAEGFRCTFCNKTFYTPSLLQVHLVKHTQEKNFLCLECGGRFVTKTSLLYHTRLHTGEKPYQCEHCDEAFISASRRMDHVRRHHMIPSLKCDICERIFKATGSLLKHKKRHINPNSRLNRFNFNQNVEKIVEVLES